MSFETVLDHRAWGSLWFKKGLALLHWRIWMMDPKMRNSMKVKTISSQKSCISINKGSDRENGSRSTPIRVHREKMVIYSRLSIMTKMQSKGKSRTKILQCKKNPQELLSIFHLKIHLFSLWPKQIFSFWKKPLKNGILLYIKSKSKKW